MSVPEETLPTQGLVDHLIELRKRLLISVLSWLLAAALCYTLKAEILQFLTQPLADAFDNPQDRRLIFTGLPEAFIVSIRLSLFSGFMLAFPVIAFQLYRFVAPGLYAREKHAVLPFMVAAPLLFYAGSALAYYYIFPLAWGFFVDFELLQTEADSLPIELEARLGEYLKLVTSMVLAFGLAFQLPLGVLLAVRGGLLSVNRLERSRRYMVVALLVAAAVMTPPDIFSQVGLFVALYGLYEVAIIAARMIETKRSA